MPTGVTITSPPRSGVGTNKRAHLSSVPEYIYCAHCALNMHTKAAQWLLLVSTRYAFACSTRCNAYCTCYVHVVCMKVCMKGQLPQIPTAVD